MKKNRLFFMFAALFVAAAVMFSCQKEEVVSLEGPQGLTLKNASLCGTLPSSPVKVLVPDFTYTYGKKETPSTGTVTVHAFNDEAKTTIVFLHVDGDTGETVEMKWANTGTGALGGGANLAIGTPVTRTITHEENWKCGDEISFRVSLKKGGSAIDQALNYTLRGLCTTTTLAVDENTVCDGDDVVLTASVKETVTQNAVTIGSVKIQEETSTDVWEDVVMVDNTFTYSADLAYGPRNFRAVYLNAGKFCASTSSAVTVDVEECGGCEDLFELVDKTACTVTDGSRFANFSFTAGEAGEVKIKGGLTAKSSDVQVVVKIDGVASTIEAVIVENENNNNFQITWTGSLEPCDVVTVDITWETESVDIIGGWSVERGGEKVGGETDDVKCD